MADIIHGAGVENSEVEKFKDSAAYETIMSYIRDIDRKIQENEIAGDTERRYDLGAPDVEAREEKGIVAFLQAVSGIVKEVPVEKEDQRYGNKGFVNFVERIKKEGENLIKKFLFSEKDKGAKKTEVLQTYLQASFGNQTRIDYGTGHELSFFCFLIVLHKMQPETMKDFFVALEQYFAIVRVLILKYKLEPAGSHGVWGLDDYQLLPLLFGTSQFCRRSDIMFHSLFEKKNRNLCYSKALRFIHVHKTYPSSKYTFEQKIEEYNTVDIEEEPFAVHSPRIYALKVVPVMRMNKGMIKMYESVVLSKWVVIQHFISSEYLPV